MVSSRSKFWSTQKEGFRSQEAPFYNVSEKCANFSAFMPGKLPVLRWIPQEKAERTKGRGLCPSLGLHIPAPMPLKEALESRKPEKLPAP